MSKFQNLHMSRGDIGQGRSIPGKRERSEYIACLKMSVLNTGSQVSLPDQVAKTCCPEHTSRGRIPIDIVLSTEIGSPSKMNALKTCLCQPV